MKMQSLNMKSLYFLSKELFIILLHEKVDFLYLFATFLVLEIFSWDEYINMCNTLIAVVN